MDIKVVFSVVKKVFPKGTEIRLDREADNAAQLYWVIPGREGEPRWVLPHQKELSWNFLRQWRPYDFRSFIKWKFLMAAYRGKRLGYVPGVLAVKIIVPKCANWSHLGWPLSWPPVPVIYVGTPGPSRKVVLALIDPVENRVVFLCKVPLEETARVAITGEADILDQLADEKPGQAPRNIFVDRVQGISAQEFISGAPAGCGLTEDHVDFLSELVVPGETLPLAKMIDDLKSRVRANEKICSDNRRLLTRVLSETVDSSTFPVVWEHGDFAPWNLKTVDNGSLRACDWEAASRWGLPLFDLLFFRVNHLKLVNEKEFFSKSFLQLCNQYIDRLGIDSSLAHKLETANIARLLIHLYETGSPAGRQVLLLEERLRGNRS